MTQTIRRRTDRAMFVCVTTAFLAGCHDGLYTGSYGYGYSSGVLVTAGVYDGPHHGYQRAYGHPHYRPGHYGHSFYRHAGYGHHQAHGHHPSRY